MCVHLRRVVVRSPFTYESVYSVILLYLYETTQTFGTQYSMDFIIKHNGITKNQVKSKWTDYFFNHLFLILSLKTTKYILRLKINVHLKNICVYYILQSPNYNSYEQGHSWRLTFFVCQIINLHYHPMPKKRFEQVHTPDDVLK